MTVDLYRDLQKKTQQLEYSVKSIAENKKKYAQAERDYKILLRKTCLQMRADGYPIGLIDKCCYGVPEVAEARLRRDIAEGVVESNMEAINMIKLQLRIINDQIAREWGHNG